MINKDLISVKLSYIEDSLASLGRLRDLPKEDFLQNSTFPAAAKYYLQTSIEAMLDTAHHIIAWERYRMPGSYADAFRVLGEKEILPADIVPTFIALARFRNRVVHLYQQIDNEEVYQMIRTGLEDFRAFTRAVVIKYLSDPGDSGKSPSSTPASSPDHCPSANESPPEDN